MSPAELAFELPGEGRALFTERVHGNMSSVTGEDAEHAIRSRERLREGIGVRRLVRGKQVHGAVVRHVGDQGLDDAAPAVEADGHATARGGVGAMVLTADCLPVALGRSAPQGGTATGQAAGGAVAMLHAGWRGLLAGVLEEGVRALDALGAAGETVAIVGPGARVCCYEVGEEVHAAFGDAHRQGRRIDLAAAGPRPAARRRRGRGAGARRLHDLRPALLLASPRRSARRTSGRGRVDRLSGLAARARGRSWADLG